MNASRMHSENEAQRAATTPVTSNDATAVGARGQAAALGVDIGAVAIKLVLIDSQGQRLGHWQRPLQGRPAELLATMLADEELLSLCADAALRIGVTGAGRNAVNGPLGRVNEIVAFSKGIAKLVPTARAAIEVGGHSARWVTLEDARGSLEDYGQNQLCAAGSGVFLEQQGSRLRIGIEEFSRLAENAPKGATIAGRCSVFAKSDMIHLQQKGTPPEEIAYGLCLAMARNFLATVLKGRELHPPIILAGGGAANGGLLRAFREVFHFSEHELLRSPLPAFETALGAAHLALSDSKLAPVQGSVLAEQLQFLDNATELSMLAPLEVKPRTPGQTVLPPEKVRAFLGIDVGSVSTNFVLTGPNGELYKSIYLPTRGQPIEALAEGLAELERDFGERLEVLGVGVTGSGRHLAATLVGGDVIHNEITCQLVGAVEAFPDVDTIFEIGGQDSKYISVRNGRIHDFTMNKICAAGTGSFLEEQAEHLGVRIIGEFSERAAAAQKPADLGCQCTVFMHSELVGAQRRGTSIEDLCAGLAYSVARNYLDRVVASRPVGESIVFQGGVASNSAVMAAFEKITGKTVHVHPFNGVSGAIGAARMVRDAAPEKSNWRGYHSCGSYELSTFECKACSNRCQVSRFVIDGRRVHFGDACERFSARDANTAASDLPDVIELREKIVQQFSPKVQNPKAILGMPRSSVFIELAPFWSTFFAHLGIQLELSAPSSFDTLQAGLRRMPAETCLPMKLAFGQLEQLAKARTEQAPRMHIFLPSIVGLPSEPQSMAYACPYVQAVPFMARAALEAPLLTPEVDLKGEDSLFLDGMEETLHILDVSRSDAQLALTRARAALQQYRAKMVELGHQQLASLDWALVVIGKPYNVLDSHLNLNLFKHLRKLGAPALPMWFLPLEDISLEEPLTTLPWHYNREIAKGLLLTLKSRRLFPVLVSNFGCGPDAFTHKHLDALLGEKPYLSLEFDEHRGEAGLITRLEAFLDEVRQHRHSEQVTVLTHLPKKESASGSAPPRFKNVKKFFVPYFSDHSHAFAAALRASGYEAEMLPIPNEQSRALGESYSSGKECHPYSMIAGDLVTLAKRQRAGGEVFVFPGTTIPCLLQQYGEGHRLILERMGVEDLDIWTPNAEGMRKLMGIDNLARMWQGFVAIDTLIKAQCEIRPYETIPGTVDAIHRQNIADLEMAIASGDIGAALAMASTRLRNVQVNRRRARPLVGVAGDIYTRINHAANHDLFRWLEEQGCEVWPAPFMVDIIDFGFRRDIDIMLRKGQYAMAALSSVLMLRKDIETWLAKRHLRSTTARMDEPGYAEVVALAKRYVGQESNEVLTLNVAKMVDFARRGAHGVINAICFGCMLGTISVAITRRIREDNNNIPIANLFYSGSPDAQLGMLEAFVHQVHERYRKQQSRGEGDW